MYSTIGCRACQMPERKRRSQPASTGSQPGTSAIASSLAKECASCESIGGPGYRVYYTMLSSTRVLILCGGDKRTQSRDIERRSSC
jgi:putative addiction module killer protein